MVRMRRWLAGAVLVTAGSLLSPSAVPVYDGVGAPDEPYLFVGRSPAPIAVSVTVPLAQGLSAALQLKSAEIGPQVLIDLAAGAFTAQGRTMTLTATPVLADGRPARGELDGNLYRLMASDSARIRPESAQGFLFLRAAVMTTPDPVIVHRASAAAEWKEQPTTRVGRDNLSTPLRALGDYAVVRLPGSKPLEEGGLSLTRILLLGGGVLVLIVITVLVLRRKPDAV